MSVKHSSIVSILLVFILAFDFTEGIFPNNAAHNLCGLSTDELIRHYVYNVQIHKVVTEDGYVLTLFRCNSKSPTLRRKRPVILSHGILLSSDDFCINPPDQSLAYILADSDYDVWLLNSRGNVYSREHVHLNPNNASSGFWNFSWYEMGIYDQPAAIDYVLDRTHHRRLYYVGFSQGTTSAMILLSEKPEYNRKIRVACLMAPIGYTSRIDPFFTAMYTLPHIVKFQSSRGFEFFPRHWLVNGLLDSFCSVHLSICNGLINYATGSSENQRNNTMLSAFICHFPSGSSIKQYYHYAQEADYGFFGRYMNDSQIPPDFPLERITAPLSIHYSTADTFADVKDVEFLIPKLHSVTFIQRIDEPFNHIDFLWGMNSASLVYSNILNILRLH